MGQYGPSCTTVCCPRTAIPILVAAIAVDYIADKRLSASTSTYTQEQHISTRSIQFHRHETHRQSYFRFATVSSQWAPQASHTVQTGTCRLRRNHSRFHTLRFCCSRFPIYRRACYRSACRIFRSRRIRRGSQRIALRNRCLLGSLQLYRRTSRSRSCSIVSQCRDKKSYHAEAWKWC
jgi:hypothetical protein